MSPERDVLRDTSEAARPTPKSAAESASLDSIPVARLAAAPAKSINHFALYGRSNRMLQQATLHQFQRTYGNQAVKRFLQQNNRQVMRTVADESPGQASDNQEMNVDRAETILKEALAIIDVALMVGLGVGELNGAADVSSPGEAQPTSGENPLATASEMRLSNDQVNHLQAAQLELQALQGSGQVEEIIAACRPILRAARGDPPAANSSASATAPIQRTATLVAGAPLLAGGPPGWAIYAGLAVVTLVAGGIVVSEMSRARERTRERAEPRVLPRTGAPPMHMGNIHVQGDDIRGTVPNFPWNRPTPMTKVEALAGLATLRGMLSTRQVSFREVAFVRAAAFINNTLHSAPPPLFRTFQNPDLINDDRYRTRRVDIEIIRGAAFV